MVWRFFKDDYGKKDDSILLPTASDDSGSNISPSPTSRKQHKRDKWDYLTFPLALTVTVVIGLFCLNRGAKSMIRSATSYPSPSILSSMPIDNEMQQNLVQKESVLQQPQIPQQALEAKISCVSDEMIEKKIVVVGAGASGLTAAKRLVLQNQKTSCYHLDVKVVEASTIKGGRVAKDTSNFADYPLDLGASWVWDIDRLPAIAQNEQILEILEGKLRDPSEIFGAAITIDEEDFTKIKAKKINEDYDQLWVNYTWYDFFEDHIASALDQSQFFYNSPVQRIAQLDNGQVVVNCKENTFIADHVLVTVPLSVLKDGDIEFQTPLPFSIKYHPGYMWKGFKIFFEFDYKFYDDLFVGYPDDGELDFWDYSKIQINSTKNILSGYYMGDVHEKFEGMTDDEIVRGVLKDLDTLYNKEATKHYVRHMLVNWAKHPYIRGTYSNEPSAPSHGPQIAWQGAKLVFSGEAFPVPPKHNGWVDGAALSGLHAAELIINQINPDILPPTKFSVRGKDWNHMEIMNRIIEKEVKEYEEQQRVRDAVPGSH